MAKGKYGQNLDLVSDEDFADFLLKFAFMTDEQLAEREALPTREARKAYVRNLPMPERKK
jgi:hypothetical protein